LGKPVIGRKNIKWKIRDYFFVFMHVLQEHPVSRWFTEEFSDALRGGGVSQLLGAGTG